MLANDAKSCHFCKNDATVVFEIPRPQGPRQDVCKVCLKRLLTVWNKLFDKTSRSIR